MKKVILALVIVASTQTVHAQLGDMMSKAKSAASTASTAATAAGFDVKQLTNSIMGQLSPKLGLTAEQLPKVTSAVTTFLNAKSQIMPLLQTNSADYKTKAAGIIGNLKTKLTGILLQNQMNKFLGLKPATNTPSNVLSQLFY